MRNLNLTDEERASKLHVTYDGINRRFEAYIDGDSETGIMLSAHRQYDALMTHLHDEGFQPCNIMIDSVAQYVRRQQIGN